MAVGDYTLVDHTAEEVVGVRVTAGERHGPWIVGGERVLQASATAPLQVQNAEVVGEELIVRLANATPGTRVHVVAGRHVPTFDPFEHSERRL